MTYRKVPAWLSVCVLFSKLDQVKYMRGNLFHITFLYANHFTPVTISHQLIFIWFKLIFSACLCMYSTQFNIVCKYILYTICIPSQNTELLICAQIKCAAMSSEWDSRSKSLIGLGGIDKMAEEWRDRRWEQANENEGKRCICCSSLHLWKEWNENWQRPRCSPNSTLDFFTLCLLKLVVTK